MNQASDTPNHTGTLNLADITSQLRKYADALTYSYALQHAAGETATHLRRLARTIELALLITPLTPFQTSTLPTLTRSELHALVKRIEDEQASLTGLLNCVEDQLQALDRAWADASE